jgi:hypothetical protein
VFRISISFIADPDPAFEVNACPDVDADPDPDPKHCNNVTRRTFFAVVSHE